MQSDTIHYPFNMEYTEYRSFRGIGMYALMYIWKETHSFYSTWQLNNRNKDRKPNISYLYGINKVFRENGNPYGQNSKPGYSFP